MFNLNKSLHNAIKTYGQPFSIISDSSPKWTFYAVLSPDKASPSHPDDSINLGTSPSQSFTLISADPIAIDHLKSDSIISNKFSTFQTFKCLKLCLSDDVVYISAQVLPYDN